MSTTAEQTTTTTTTTNPVVNAPHNDTTVAPAVIDTIEDHPVNNTTTTAASNPNAKVTPIQRINSLYNKAKHSFNEVLTDAQRAVNEKSNAQSTTTAEATTNEAPHNNNIAEKKVGASNNASFKDILNRIKVCNFVIINIKQH